MSKSDICWDILLWVGIGLFAVPCFVYVITRAFYAARTGSWRRAVRDTLNDIRAKEDDR